MKFLYNIRKTKGENKMDNQQPSNKMEWRTTCESDKYEVNSKRKNFAIYRIVANAFIPNPKGHLEVNHKDHDRLNKNFYGVPMEIC